LLEEPPLELPRAGALATADRCASDDPWLPVRSVPPDPRGASVVVVWPAAVVVVAAGALPDFDFVLTAVLVVAPSAAPALVLVVVGVTDGAAGMVVVVVVVTAGADDP
jgi:hypothetical protein